VKFDEGDEMTTKQLAGAGWVENKRIVNMGQKCREFGTKVRRRVDDAPQSYFKRESGMTSASRKIPGVLVRL
jgi:hypothetical protein